MKIQLAIKFEIQNSLLISKKFSTISLNPFSLNETFIKYFTSWVHQQYGIEITTALHEVVNNRLLPFIDLFEPTVSQIDIQTLNA